MGFDNQSIQGDEVVVNDLEFGKLCYGPGDEDDRTVSYCPICGKWAILDEAPYGSKYYGQFVCAECASNRKLIGTLESYLS